MSRKSKFNFYLKNRLKILLIIITVLVVSYFLKVLYPRDNFEIETNDLIVILISIPIFYILWIFEENRQNKSIQKLKESFQPPSITDLYGETIYVEIKLLDKSKKHIENYSFIGTIYEITDDRIIKIKRKGKPDFGIPYNEIGIYKSSNFEKKMNTKYFTNWEVIIPYFSDLNELSNFKSFGFTGFK